MSSANWWSFCLDLNVLKNTEIRVIMMPTLSLVTMKFHYDNLRSPSDDKIGIMTIFWFQWQYQRFAFHDRVGRHDMEILSALLAICESIPPVANAKCHKCGALVFSLSLAWTNCWTNSELSAIWVFIWCHCDNSSTREHDNAERALMERHLHVESIQLTSEVEKISRVGWLGRSGAPEFTYMRARPTNMTWGHCDKTLATVSIWSLSYIESITLFSSWF